MRQILPDAIVNCSAYNAVDAAESDPATAYAVNASGPGNLAAVASHLDSLLIHYSTDFVFDGTGAAPYNEDDATNPLSVYGASKLFGEAAVRTAPRHYVLRVESLFGGKGVNGHRTTIDYFAETLAEPVPVRALVDRTVTPSYVPDVAEVTLALIDGQAAYGTYHCVNSGHTTWFELALHVADRLGVRGSIKPATSAERQTTATRPQYCALSNQKLAAAGIEMPTWQSAIGRHLADRGAGPSLRLTTEHLSA